MEILSQIGNEDWLKALYKVSNVYVVGGYVRDHFLKRSNKDIDLLIEGLSIDKIIEILKNFGKVDLVGKSFGVLKFKPIGYIGEDYDIAVPRKDIKTGVGHKDFNVDIDNVSIIEDLKRRDFTINSIAINVKTNEIIDPFNGISDINKRLIKATDKNAFIEDPLRILRAIQFASRFRFDIEENTLNLIKDNVDKISHISSERILAEFDKIVLKNGSIPTAFKLIKDTGVDLALFSNKLDMSQMDYEYLDKYSFYFILGLFTNTMPSEFYKNKLRGDNETYEILKHIEYIFEKTSMNNLSIPKLRKIVFNAIQKNDKIFDVVIFPNYVHEVFKDMDLGIIPTYIKDININGNDIIEKFNVSGKTVGDILNKVYVGALSNKFNWKDKNEILTYIETI